VAGPTGPADSLYSQNSTDQSVNGTDNYITGSNLSYVANAKIGTRLRWVLHASKTNAGTAAPTFNVRFGSGATVTDAARLSWTDVAQTAATDNACIIIDAVVRATGASTVVVGGYTMGHRNGASGFRNAANAGATTVVSTGWSASTDTSVGLSVNPGASGVWTFSVVASCLENKV